VRGRVMVAQAGSRGEAELHFYCVQEIQRWQVTVSPEGDGVFQAGVAQICLTGAIVGWKAWDACRTVTLIG